MKYATLLLIIIASASCTVKKNIKIQQLTNSEINSIYAHKNFDLNKVLIVSSAKSYITLSNKDLNILPFIIIFDKNGEEINFKKENYCRVDLEEFISEYDSGKITDLKKGKNNINDYLDNFKPLLEPSKYSIKNIKSLQKNLVFINTASYSNVFDINKESFKLSKINSSNFEIFLVNVDLQEEWKIETIDVKN